MANPTFKDFLTKLQDPSSEQLKRELDVVIGERHDGAPRRFWRRMPVQLTDVVTAPTEEFSRAPFEQGEDERVIESMSQLERTMAASPQWKGAGAERLGSACEGLEKSVARAQLSSAAVQTLPSVWGWGLRAAGT
jgi:hypothetical protein